MADNKKSSAKDEQEQVKDLPQPDVSKDGAEQVTGGKSPQMNWDIPAGTASPSA